MGTSKHMCNHSLVWYEADHSHPYLLFSIYLNDGDSMAEGLQGALAGFSNFAVLELLLPDYLSLLSIVHE